MVAPHGSGGVHWRSGGRKVDILPEAILADTRYRRKRQSNGWTPQESLKFATNRIGEDKLATSEELANMFRPALYILAGLSAAVAVAACRASDSGVRREPEGFAIIFLMGYAGDHLPGDADTFERLIKTCRDAHYNTILGKYEATRMDVLKRHGLAMMVDLLVPDHHVYKNREGAEALCRSLHGQDAVYAYHLWSDRVGGQVAGRNRDIANVHTWDPGHAVYVGDYNARTIGSLEQCDIVGYYDFHWKRGGHFRHLHRAWAAAKKHGKPWLKYTDGSPGKIGVGNYNRVLYTISTSIAFGLKGYMFHYVGNFWDARTGELGPVGRDWKRVNAEFVRIGPELMRIGIPEAVYSTSVTRTAKGRPTGENEPAVPREFKPVPEDAWFGVEQGEAIVGVFEEHALFFANHNAYDAQTMRLKVRGHKTGRLCDRASGTWRPLPEEDGRFTFEIPPAAGELVQFSR